MKESARTAISLVKSLADEYGIDKTRFEKTDIHIHVREGAVPKDGPSAGVTMATVIMSAFSGRPVSGKVAMTAKLLFAEKYFAIGGLREKTLAAYRVGIRKVIIPKDNEKTSTKFPKKSATVWNSFWRKVSPTFTITRWFNIKSMVIKTHHI